MSRRTRMTIRFGVVAVLGLSLSLGLLAGCSSSGAEAGNAKPGSTKSATQVSDGSESSPSKGDDSPTPPFEVKTISETLVDTSRKTAATSSSAELPSRTLVTTIIYPDAPGRFPLIVFSHGLTGDPSRHTEMSSAWARMGYVVAMPKFPLTSADSPNAVTNVGDVANQTGDVSFVIDQMIAANGDADSPLHNKILTDRIGVSGHSLGGATTYGVAANDCCRDSRVDAVLIMSGFRALDKAKDHLDEMPPTMLIHGVNDRVLKIENSDSAYPLINSPKWYVTLLTAGHSEAYENDPSPSDGVVTAVTTDFWEAYLPAKEGKPSAKILDRMRSDAVVDGISTLQSDPG